MAKLEETEIIDNSTNLTKKKREYLLDICSKLEENEDVSAKDIAELKNYISSFKYGLVFEKHEEPVDVALRNNTPIFKEFKHIINNPNSTDSNFLLEGDNLHSLKLLEKTHKGKVDVIYIDPPYNTLNEDFKYADKMLDENDGYIHSKWLSFMESRLKIAYNLLSKNGIIFISIDDNEHSQLKLLCDSIFGEKNRLSTITVETAHGVFGPKASHVDKTIVKVKDYILVYSKDNQTEHSFQPLYMPSDTLFDTHYNKYISSITSIIPLTSHLKSVPWVNDEFSKYSLKVSLDNVSKLMSLSNRFRKYIYEDIVEKIYGDWPFTASVDFEDNDVHVVNNLMVFKTAGNKYRYYRCLSEAVRKTDDYCQSTALSYIVGDLWKDFNQDMTNVAKEGNVDFKNAKKPIRLIKRILKFVNKKDAVVLDFFAGSGTTGHAVLDLNKEDGGNRKFILCTNNEISPRATLNYIKDNGYLQNYKPQSNTPSSAIKNKIEKFYNEHPDVYENLIIENCLDYQKYGICQSITFQRMKNIINESSDGFKTNILYFQTDMISNSDEDREDKLCDASDLMIALENMSLLSDPSIAIAYCEEETDEIFKMKINNIKTLYLANDVLLSSEQNELLKTHNIEIKIIPDYFYSTFGGNDNV